MGKLSKLFTNKYYSKKQGFNKISTGYYKQNTGMKKHIRTRVLPEKPNKYLEFETKIGYIPQNKIGVDFHFISQIDFNQINNKYHLKDYRLFDDKYLFLMNYNNEGEFLDIKQETNEDIIKSAIQIKNESFKISKGLSYILKNYLSEK